MADIDYDLCTSASTTDGQIVPVRDVKLYAETLGQGPALICIPGAANVMEWYRPIAGALSKSRTVVMFDTRGVGRSSPTNNVTVDILAQDVLGLARHFGFERFDVLGQSMGGLVAQHLLAKYGDAINCAVLLNSAIAAASTKTLRAFNDGALEHPIAAVAGLEPPERIAQVGPIHFSKEFVGTAAYESWLDWQTKLAAQPATLKAYLRAALMSDISQELSRVSVPVLVVAGTEDQVAPVEKVRELAKAIPGSQYVELAGGSHAMLFERPDWVSDAVLGFIDNSTTDK